MAVNFIGGANRSTQYLMYKTCSLYILDLVYNYNHGVVIVVIAW
jgi:hypothetical protein